MNATLDHELERRLRATLQEVMPQLERSALNAPNGAAPKIGGDAEMPRRHRALGIAASFVVTLGVGATLLAMRATDDASPSSDAPRAESSSPMSVAPAPTVRSPLHTALSAEETPTALLAGWTIDGYSGITPVTPTQPSSACAGCAVSRLIVAEDPMTLGGSFFTAWSIDDDYDIGQFDTPVTVGSIGGGAISSIGDTTAGARHRVRLAWPIAPGRTAFVDATGFADADVVAMAAELSFDGRTPTLASLPAGFSVVSAATPGFTRQQYTQFLSDVPLVAGREGSSVVELIATDGGAQGLFDWRNPGTEFGEWGPTRMVDGATVVVDLPEDEGQPILTIVATWTVGEWNYTAIGHVFNSEAEFLDVIGSLRLADAATFAAATETASPSTLTDLIPNATGTSATFAR